MELDSDPMGLTFARHQGVQLVDITQAGKELLAVNCSGVSGGHEACTGGRDIWVWVIVTRGPRLSVAQWPPENEGRGLGCPSLLSG